MQSLVVPEAGPDAAQDISRSLSLLRLKILASPGSFPIQSSKVDGCEPQTQHVK